MKQFCFLLIFMLTGCAMQVPAVSDYDTAYDYASVKQYAWLSQNPVNKQPVAELPEHVDMQSDLVHQRIRRAVDQELQSRNLTKVEPAQADLLVMFHLGIEEEWDYDTFYGRFGYYPCYYCYEPANHRVHGEFHHRQPFEPRQYTMGTIVVDIIDAKDKRLVYRGSSERILPNLQTPAERQAYIDETVKAILRDLPIPL